MNEPKNPPEFYAARDDVEHGLLPKRSMRTLRKHRAALMARSIWQDQPNVDDALFRKAQWRAAVEKEIESRAASRRNVSAAIWQKVVAGLIVAAIIAIVSHIYSSCASTAPKEQQTPPEIQSAASHSSSSPTSWQP